MSEILKVAKACNFVSNNNGIFNENIEEILQIFYKYKDIYVSNSGLDIVNNDFVDYYYHFGDVNYLMNEKYLDARLALFACAWESMKYGWHKMRMGRKNKSIETFENIVREIATYEYLVDDDFSYKFEIPLILTLIHGEVDDALLRIKSKSKYRDESRTSAEFEKFTYTVNPSSLYDIMSEYVGKNFILQKLTDVIPTSIINKLK